LEVVVVPSAKSPAGRAAKTSRIELRASQEDRAFLLAQGRLAAQRVLADRERFLLNEETEQEWERINSRAARTLPGLARLLERPSPFSQQA